MQTEPLQRHFSDVDSLCRYVRDLSGNTCLLSFSGGKDALACWIKLREHFDRIVPYYLYLVPGLSFIDDSLKYYEDAFKAEILRLPHPGLMRMLRDLVYQPPERIAVIEDLKLPRLTQEDVETSVRKKSGAEAAYIAIGNRMKDNLTRFASIKRHGAANHIRRSFFPVFDWSTQQVADAIRSAGLRLSIEYDMFGRTFDGLNVAYLRPIRDRYPDDYDRILKLFPLAELELYREEVLNAPDQPEEASDDLVAAS